MDERTTYPAGSDRSSRAFRPEEEGRDRSELKQHQPGKEVRVEDLRIEFICEDRGVNTAPNMVVLRATGTNPIWNGQADGELRLNLLNQTGQQAFVPGQKYILAFQQVSMPVAAGAGEETEQRRSAL